MSGSESRSEGFPFGTLLVTVGWGLLYIGARALLELELAPWLRVLVALVPVPFVTLFLVMIVRGIRQMDELERRIHLEAVGVAYPLAILLFMTLGLLELAIPLKKEDWSYRHVWIYLPIFYFIGLAIARKRYQ